MKNLPTLLILALFLVSCVTTLSLEGNNVQIIDVSQKGKYECNRIGFINSTNAWATTKGGEKQNVYTDLLNKAANAKANAIVIQSENSSWLTGASATAEALDCKKLP